VPRIAYESGNSDYVIKQHYLKLLLPSEAQAWFAVTPKAVDDFKKQQAAEKEATAPKTQRSTT
jgi:hypothetical protein